MENNFQLPQAPENKYINSSEYARKIQSAYYRMRPKIFIERFKNLNLIAQIGIFFFPLISIVTSVSFIYGHMMVLGNLYLAVIISVLLLGIVELTKNYLLTNGLDTYFSNSGKSMGTFVFAFLFSALSFVMSYNGAEMLVKNMDTSKQVIKDSSLVNLTAVDNNYSLQIAAEQSKIDNINAMAKKQWHGLHTTEQTTLLTSIEENIKTLRLLGEKEKDRILSEKSVNLSTAESSVNYNAWIFKIFAGIIEFLLILSITFEAFYKFKTVREDMDLKNYKTDPNRHISLEPKNIKIIGENQPAQAPSIGLNSGNNERKVVGFLQGISNDKDRMYENRTVLQNGLRTCKNCNAEFVAKHHKQVYCNNECRIQFWEQKNGRILIMKKAK